MELRETPVQAAPALAWCQHSAVAEETVSFRLLIPVLQLRA